MFYVLNIVNRKKVVVKWSMGKRKGGAIASPSLFGTKRLVDSIVDFRASLELGNLLSSDADRLLS